MTTTESNWTEFLCNLKSMLRNIDNGRPVKLTLNHYGNTYNYNSADEGIYNTADIIQWYMYYGKNVEYWAKFDERYPKLKNAESVKFCKALGIDYKTLVDMYKMVRHEDIDPDCYNWEWTKEDAINTFSDTEPHTIMDWLEGKGNYYSSEILDNWDEYYAMGQFIDRFFYEMQDVYKIWFIFTLYYRNSNHLDNTVKYVIRDYVDDIVRKQDREMCCYPVKEDIFEHSSLPYLYEYEYPDF